MGNLCSSKPYSIDDLPPPLDLSKEYSKKEYESLAEYQYPFENLVFEGGGVKGIAYTGAMQVLNDVGILPRIKRYAGASAGAMTAALLAVGYTPEEVGGMQEFNNQYYAEDASCGCCSLFPNLYRSYGWHPGNRLLNYYKKLIGKKTEGKENYTFKELYDDRGIELCIVVTCLSKLSVEYFHPKTTPDVPIALAVRMSVGVPGFFQPVRITKLDNALYYVDGGLLDNYCIKCFDGWFLSMKANDNFFLKMSTDDPPFEGHNDKTIGMMVYATDEIELLKLGVHQRYKGHDLQRPNTELARQRGPSVDQALADMSKKMKVLTAAKILLHILHEKNINSDAKINKNEFKEAFGQLETDYPEHMSVLFGEGFSYTEALDAVDGDKDGEITFHDFIQFIQKKGLVSPLNHINSVSKSSIISAADYMRSILETFLLQGQRQNVSESDVKRTIGIHTDYVRSLDFNNESEDRFFLRQQGRIATVNFLREYITENHLQPKTEETVLNDATKTELCELKEQDPKQDSGPNSDNHQKDETLSSDNLQNTDLQVSVNAGNEPMSHETNADKEQKFEQSVVTNNGQSHQTVTAALQSESVELSAITS